MSSWLGSHGAPGRVWAREVDWHSGPSLCLARPCLPVCGCQDLSPLPTQTLLHASRIQAELEGGLEVWGRPLPPCTPGPMTASIAEEAGGPGHSVCWLRAGRGCVWSAGRALEPGAGPGELPQTAGQPGVRGAGAAREAGPGRGPVLVSPPRGRRPGAGSQRAGQLGEAPRLAPLTAWVGFPSRAPRPAWRAPWRRPRPAT